MRHITSTITGVGNVDFYYPNENAFLNDNNYIEVVLPQEQLTVKYTFINYADNSTLGEFAYKSPFKSVKISLNSIFNYMTDRYNETNASISCHFSIVVGSSEYTLPIALFFKILKGTSYPDRTHGTLFFYIYDGDDPSNTEIYFPTNGTITIDGGLTQNVTEGINYIDLSSISDEGTHKINFTTSSFSPSVQIISFDPVNENDFTVNINYIENDGNLPFTYIGDLLQKDLQTLSDYNIYFDYVTTCANNIFEIKYYDADGCIRYLAGKITQITSSANQKNLLYEQDIYNNIPNYIYNEEQKDVTVVFDNIKHDAHIEDLLQSVSIWYMNNDYQWFKCQLSTKNIKNVENSDYELTFTINKK